MVAMMDPARHASILREQLLIQPRRREYRYNEAADHELRQILFRSLAGQKDEYLLYFFPQGPPQSSDEPWSLRTAQGAQEGAEYLPSAKGTACGHIFKSGESTYSCKTCAADETCVLCSKCFECSDHEGHQVYVSVSPGNSGCCDCGDAEAWRREVRCSIHTADMEGPESKSGSGKEPMFGSSRVPQDLVEAMRTTIAQAVDYLCDVFSCSPEQLRLPKTEQSIRSDERLSRLSSGTYGTDPEEPAEKEYALLLWNDEKHTVYDVQNQVAKACSKPKSFGLQKAYEVNDNGRAIVHHSTNLQELEHMAKVLEQIKITVTVRSSRDTFREQMCETIIEWMSDIAGCATGEDHYLLRNIVCEELLRTWRIGSEASNKDIGLAGIDDHELDETEKAKRRYATLFRPTNPTGGAVIRVEVDPGEEENDEDDEDDDDEDVEEDDDDMEIEIEDIRQAAQAAMQADAADMDIDFAEDGDDVTEAMEAAIAGYPPPPPPPPPTTGQRRRVFTPAESEDDQPEAPLPALNANTPFGQVPKTPKKKVVNNHPQRPSKHWLQKPEGYKGRRPSDPAEDLWQRVRMDWLILYDLRLWKTLRIKLRHLYITNVATIPHFKRILGLRFAGLYTPLAELYLIADREPDHSIINLSVQMLTTPSITEEVVERGNFLTNLMAILYTFLTTRQVGFPEDVQPRATLAFEAGSVTNRRMFHFFVDMRWLFQSEFIHHKMRTEPRYLLQFLDLVKLHQGLCPNVRALGEHVEYESDAWISASLIIKEIDRLCKAVATSYEPRPGDLSVDGDMQRAIRNVAQVTMINSFGYERNRFRQHEMRDDMAWHEVGPFDQPVETGKRYSVPKLVVQSEPMSFHHPLHYLLSWLLENAKSMKREDMRALLHFSPADLKDPWNRDKGAPAPQTLTSDELLSGIFDHPLRTCSWLAQMKAGMWVRNGITLRHQAHTYRSVSHRDIGYQRDLLMIQAGFVLCGSEEEKPGERFLAQMIDRFQMVDWMRGDFAVVPGFEEPQQLDVLEDFYHLIVVALSERGNLTLDSAEAQQDKMLQHDIAHALCFKPLSFSDLNTRVTEKIADSDSFQRVLEDMTIYHAPEGLSDIGRFELKPEYIELVDPYYAHYSRNHREEAENVHKRHIARKTGKKVEDVVYEPTLVSLEGGLFEQLPALTRTPLFATVIAAALQFATMAEEAAPNTQSTRIETFLHMVLHLTLIAVLEDEKSTDGSFVELAAAKRGNFPSILTLLITLSESPVYPSVQPAAKHILRKMQSRQPEKLSGALGLLSASLDRTDTASPASLSAEDKEKKKQDALARQARVMAQMKQQQNSFLVNQGLAGFDDEEFDDLEDDMSILQDEGAVPEYKKTWNFPTGTCILCQEETNDQRLYGTFAFLGESNILRSTPVDDQDFVQEVMEVPENLDRSADEIRPFGVAGKNKYTVKKTTGDGKVADFERQGLSKGFPHAQHSTRGPVSTTCGHIMHYSCFELYLGATSRRHQAQIARSQPEDLAHKEFICPLCKALGNTFLPIIWKGKECAHENELHSAKAFDDWLAESTSTYMPDLGCLTYQNELAHFQQRGHEVFSQRSSEFVGNTFVPSLATAVRDTSAAQANQQTPADDPPRYSLRSRGLSLSSLFSMRRSNDDATSPSVSEPMSRMAELAKAYQRVDETIRANRLCTSAQIDDSSVNPVSPLSRALGFSVSALEIQLRGTAHDSASPSVVGDLSEQNLTHLRILSETIESYLAVNVLRGTHAHVVSRESAIKREYLIALLFGSESEITMINVRDLAGGLLFEDDVFLFYADWLSFLAPNVAEAVSVLQLCYWAEIVKVIYVFKSLVRSGSVSAPQDTALEHVTLTPDFVLAVQKLSSEDTRDPYSNNQVSHVQLKVLRLLIEKYAQTFLRKSILLMHIRYGLDFECPFDLDTTMPELARLTKLLHIPSIDAMSTTYISCSPAGRRLATLSHRWIGQANMITEHPRTLHPIKLSHPAIFELIGLPKNYDTLTEEAIKRRCPTTGKEITDPAVCLFCGAIFCSQATCCMKGAGGPDNNPRGGCWQHMQKCGGKIGIFINIRKCMVLFLHTPMSGSFAHAPYLDRHGEPDPTLRRHHQLFLNQRRYDKLMREVWLGHGVPTFISRKLEADLNPGWFYRVSLL